MEIIALSQFLKFGAALVFVVALMVGLSFLVKRFGMKEHSFLPSQKRRLKVVEIAVLDSRRRMALIQRDDQQHLVILGPNGETVVETGIKQTEMDASQNDAAKKAA